MDTLLNGPAGSTPNRWPRLPLQPPSLSPSLPPSCSRPTAPATAAQRPGGGSVISRTVNRRSLEPGNAREQKGRGKTPPPQPPTRAAPRGAPRRGPAGPRATYATGSAGPVPQDRPPYIQPAVHAVHAAQPAWPPPGRIVAPRGFADAVEGQLALSSFACSQQRMCW